MERDTVTFQGKQKGICDEESDRTANHKLHSWHADFLCAFFSIFVYKSDFVLIIHKPNKTVMTSPLQTIFK